MYLANGTAEFLPANDPNSNLFAGDISLVLELYQQHVDAFGQARGHRLAL